MKREVTWGNVIRICWALFWRQLLIVTASGGLLGFLVGLLMGATGSSENLITRVCLLLGLIISPVGYLIAMKMIVGKDFGEFHLMVIPNEFGSNKPKNMPADMLRVPEADIPLASYRVYGRRAFLGRHPYSVTIRRNTVSFLNKKTGEEVVIDPKKEDYGLHVKNPHLHSTNNIILINRNGDSITLSGGGAVVKDLKRWWKQWI